MTPETRSQLDLLGKSDVEKRIENLRSVTPDRLRAELAAMSLQSRNGGIGLDDDACDYLTDVAAEAGVKHLHFVEYREFVDRIIAKHNNTLNDTSSFGVKEIVVGSDEAFAIFKHIIDELPHSAQLRFFKVLEDDERVGRIKLDKGWEAKIKSDWNKVP